MFGISNKSETHRNAIIVERFHIKGCSKLNKRAIAKQVRYEKIIEAATELFLNRGVQNVQMQDIADAAEIGIATLFRYFPKKEYIVVSASNAITDYMTKRIESIISQPITAYEMLEQVLDYYMESSLDPDLRLAKFFESLDLYKKMASEMPNQHDEYLKNRNKLANTLLQIAELGNKDGSLRSELDLKLAVITIIQNFSSYTYKSSLTVHDESIAEFVTARKQQEMLKDMFLQYVGT